MRAPIRSVVTQVPNIDPKRGLSGSEFTYIDISAVDQDSKVVREAKRLPITDAPSRARQLLKAGDILVSTVRPNLNAVAVVPDALDGSIGSTGFCVLRANPTEADPSYLFHWVKSKAFIEDMIRKATGASYPAVSDRIVLDSTVPLPSLEEQRRIAAILDQAEELRAKRRAAIALLDQLPQAIFLEMFGDPATNPKGWPIRRVDEVTECLDRLRRPVKKSDRLAGPIPYYGANGLQGWIDRALFDEPLVLVAEDGGHFADPMRGVAYRIDGPAWVNNHAHILRPKPMVTEIEFLHRVLRHYNFLPFISGTTRSKLTQGQLAKATIPLPPLDLQHRFAARVEAIHRAKAAHQSALAELDVLFASLQHQAFRKGGA